MQRYGVRNMVRPSFAMYNTFEEVERLADHVALIEAGRLRVAETTESLLGRFRRMEVDCETAWPAGELPGSWLGWQSGIGRTSFIETAYDRAVTEAHCRRFFPTGGVQAPAFTCHCAPQTALPIARNRRSESL